MNKYSAKEIEKAIDEIIYKAELKKELLELDKALNELSAQEIVNDIQNVYNECNDFDECDCDICSKIDWNSLELDKNIGYTIVRKNEEGTVLEKETKLDIIVRNDYELEISKTTSLLRNTLIQKNRDYGDSVHKQFVKYGRSALMIRIEDKFNRLDNLMNGSKQEVKEENIEDTILDMMGYLTLAYIELQLDKKE